ncbi:unnamed protein product [Miscanthus lutarioriparius]|uniref:EF-hand domain-containing protein n=1 Tax=Miscanthus lutarioriparius TaxID=422564 RepID=A0A811R3H2_9POAL|nr:unnamed protein product [Miscanthus lutarioriparius]
MSVEILDGSTVRSFVEDEGAFNTSVDGRFAALDADHDGLLTYAEMAGELMSLRVLEKHFGVDEAAVAPDELARLYLKTDGVLNFEVSNKSQHRRTLLTSYTPTGAVAATLLPIFASDHADLTRILAQCSVRLSVYREPAKVVAHQDAGRRIWGMRGTGAGT